MAIDIRNFVDVKITKAVPGRQLEYDTVVVYDPTGTNAEGYYGTVTAGGDGTTKATAKDITTLTGSNTVDMKAWAALFVKNGGQYIHYVKTLTYDATNDIWKNGTKEIPATEIVICAFGNVTPGSGDVKYGSGIQQKILLVDNATNFATAEGVVQLGKTADNKPAIITSAALAAYFTVININVADAIKDCMFTKVICTDAEATKYVATGTLDSETYITFDYLAGAYRLLGGNDCLKNDVVNLWAKIVLTQVLSNNLITLLTSKIRLDTAGVASVKNCCAKVLTQFVNNGYLKTDKAWTGADLYIDGNLVAAENTPLIDGYTVYVGPIEKKYLDAHQIPPVYILYGDQVGVRKIVVSGEVF